jgi:hypothetical protein
VKRRIIKLHRITITLSEIIIKFGVTWWEASFAVRLFLLPACLDTDSTSTVYQNQNQNISMAMLRTLQHFYGGECFSPSPFSLELYLHLFNSSTITRKIIKEYRGVTKAGSTSGHSDRPPSSFASLFSGARLTMPPSSSYLGPTWQRELARLIALFF